jgi:hypothetical protein
MTAADVVFLGYARDAVRFALGRRVSVSGRITIPEA